MPFSLGRHTREPRVTLPPKGRLRHVVMDIEEDSYIPFILGHPFMSTASCMVDMGKKMLQMGIEDQKISFDLFHEDKDPLDQNVYLKVHVMDERRPEKKVLEVGTLLEPG